ncbi:MAG: helix-turn-helix transcriptional regulator [Thermoactinomyces sp.]
MSDVRVDRVALGKFIRQQRKEKNLRQKDLVDEFLTQPVLSTIENGKGQVSEKKLIYVLRKLGIEKDLSHFYTRNEGKNEKEKNEELKLKLIAIENIIDLVSPDLGLEQLRELGIPEDHPLSVSVHYLKGKSYIGKRKWKKAHRHFFDVIYLIEQKFPNMATTNLKAASYSELSFIEYAQNHFVQALRYAQQALECFLEDGKRKYCKEIILVSKAIYLEKLNRLEDAQNTLHQLENAHTCKAATRYISKEASLNMYDIRSSILAKTKMHSQAIKYALKGIELARIDKMTDRLFELWVTLGSIYMENDQLDFAFICLDTALKLQKKVSSQALLAYVYIQLGVLHEKRKQSDKAHQLALEAIKFSKNSNNAYRECEALILLGNCYFQQNRNDQAFQTMKSALEIAKKHGFTDLRNKLNLIIGTRLNKLGDPHAHTFVLDFLHSYMKTFEGGDDEMPVNIRATGEPPNT